MHTPQFTDALIPFLGNKRRLAPLIFADLAEVLARKEWADCRFLDPMCGSGAVALHAKALGFDVTASDLAVRGQIAARALIANSRVQLTRTDLALHMRLAREMRAPPVADTLPLPRVPADFFATAIAAAGQVSSPKDDLLRLLLMHAVLHSFPMSLPSATDAPKFAAGDLDAISPRRLGHYVRSRLFTRPEALWAIAEAVNRGVIGGSGAARAGDAREVIPAIAPEVVYLDPPFPGTTAYGRAYAVLDALIGDDGPAREAPPRLDELLDAARDVPIAVISYGGPRTDLEHLTAVAGRHRCVRVARSIPYPHLAAVAKEVNRARNHELLVMATRD